MAVSCNQLVPGSKTRKTASARTLALLLELLLAVVSYEYLSMARAQLVDVAWLAGDCPAAARD